jgi:uncharacterized protein GlcG (DUF336 family)
MSVLANAQRVAQAAVDHAVAHEVRIAVVVLDQSFEVVAAMRMDGAYPHAVRLATAKAHAALSFGAATDALRQRITEANAASIASVEPRMMLVGGGVPVELAGGRMVAVGVSGGSEQQDTECARAGVEAMGAAG